MSGSRAAIRYAKAILSYSLEKKQETQVNNDMLLIASTIEKSEDLQLLLSNPIIKNEIKRTAINKVFDKKISEPSKQLIDLLITNRRLGILEYVTKKYTVIYDELKGIEVAQVTSATPLSKQLTSEILEKVKQLTGKKATLKNIINPDIIGGFILRVGDVQYDASISNKLLVLKRQFEDNSFTSKL